VFVCFEIEGVLSFSETGWLSFEFGWCGRAVLRNWNSTYCLTVRWCL